MQKTLYFLDGSVRSTVNCNEASQHHGLHILWYPNGQMRQRSQH